MSTLAKAIERLDNLKKSWKILLPMLEKMCYETPNDQELGEKIRKLVLKWK